MRPTSRLEFAEFLRKVASHSYGKKEWKLFVVAHYQDEQLEEIRRNLVRLCIGRAGGKEWSDSEFAALQQWSRELKAPPSNTYVRTTRQRVVTD